MWKLSFKREKNPVHIWDYLGFTCENTQVANQPVNQCDFSFFHMGKGKCSLCLVLTLITVDAVCAWCTWLNSIDLDIKTIFLCICSPDTDYFLSCVNCLMLHSKPPLLYVRDSDNWHPTRSPFRFCSYGCVMKLSGDFPFSSLIPCFIWPADRIDYWLALAI